MKAFLLPTVRMRQHQEAPGIAPNPCLSRVKGHGQDQRGGPQQMAASTHPSSEWGKQGPCRRRREGRAHRLPAGSVRAAAQGELRPLPVRQAQARKRPRSWGGVGRRQLTAGLSLLFGEGDLGFTALCCFFETYWVKINVKGQSC